MSSHYIDPLANQKLGNFQIPLERLEKIEPHHVVQFSIVAHEPMGEGLVVKVLAQTRGGFKIYEEGLGFQFQPVDQLAFTLAYTAQPKAQTQFDGFTKKNQNFYLNGTQFSLTSPVFLDAQGQLLITVQSCSINMCLLPSTFSLKMAVGSQSELKSIGQPVGTIFTPLESSLLQASRAPSAPIATTSDSWTQIPNTLLKQVEGALQTQSPMMFPALVLAGLAMNLTPCVYPMIPLTLNTFGFLGGQKGSPPLARSTVPLFYGFGIVLSYSLLGVIAGLTGSLFGSWLQSPVVNVAISLFLFAMGFAMLGFGNFSFLQHWGHKLPLVQSKPRSSAFFMGCLSSCVSAPCTGPVLSLLLVLIGHTQDPLYGFILMALFSSGFALPYLVLGIGTQKAFRMPKAPWLVLTVKYFFASLLFALAVSYLRGLTLRWPLVSVVFTKPSPTALGFTCGLFALSVTFLIIGTKRFHKALTVGALLGATTLLTWATMGITSSWVLSSKPSNKSPSTSFNTAGATTIQWIPSFQEGAALAQSQSKPLLVDLWATWCTACLEMDQNLWTDPQVISLVNTHFIAVKVDFTAFTAEGQMLTESWKLAGLPAVGIYGAGEKPPQEPRILFRKSLEPLELINALKEALAK